MIIQGNFFEETDQLKSGSIDCIMSDVPYGTVPDVTWDIPIPLDNMWECFDRLLTHDGVVVLTGMQPYTSKLVVSNTDWFRFSMIWKKDIPIRAYHDPFLPMKDYEDILIFSKTPLTLHQYWCNTSVLEIPGLPNRKKIHPCEKPVKLYKHLLHMLTKPGETVLDVCAGSGAVGVACKETNRHYILVEQDETFYKGMVERLA
jgi:site-specific DNA-methyltransferase (adenine-specific)